MHDQTHETLLESLLVGDADPATPAVRAHLAACAECRASWEEMQRVTRSLDELAHPAQDVLSDAGDLRRAPGERDAERLLRAEIAATSGAGRPRPGRLLPVLLALAALLLAAFGIRTWLAEAPPQPRVDPTLGDVGQFAPKGECRELFPVRWTGKREPGDQPRLRIETRLAGSQEWTPLYEGPFPASDTGLSWAPTEEQRRQCGPRIRYRVIWTRETVVSPGNWVEAWVR